MSLLGTRRWAPQRPPTAGEGLALTASVYRSRVAGGGSRCVRVSHCPRRLRDMCSLSPASSRPPRRPQRLSRTACLTEAQSPAGWGCSVGSAARWGEGAAPWRNGECGRQEPRWAPAPSPRRLPNCKHMARSRTGAAPRPARRQRAWGAGGRCPGSCQGGRGVTHQGRDGGLSSGGPPRTLGGGWETAGRCCISVALCLAAVLQDCTCVLCQGDLLAHGGCSRSCLCWRVPWPGTP